MNFVPNDDVIRAFAANGSDNSFAVRILPGRPGCDEHLLDSHVLQALSEVAAVDRITISKEITRLGPVRRECLGHLLGCPHSRWMLRHVEVKDSPPVMSKNDEAEQQPERDSRYNEEIACGRAVHVVLEECSPGLRWWPWTSLDHVLGDCGFRHVIAKESKLGLDPRRSPERILQGHTADQPADLGGNFRSAAVPRLPAPVQPKAPAMPADDRVRLDKNER